ncbi:hypothetical protein [Xylanimonas ulmi]|uniref:Lipoprotein n=1 Tax=Xylanimonas ulmi TaxID=228973 RepID=A0A4Q7M0K2_9MICO|nr:hypothetical protein [Xylanibacterium ulmi]RZS60884.1 hypothetical protein EV386_1164 [Xylanibacterium ulmi]
MRAARAATASALLVMALAAAGCDGGAQPEPPGAQTPADASEDAATDDDPTHDAAQDTAACAAVSDAQSIVENADIALREGRISDQEQQGWYAVATRVLHRIPSGGDSAVSQGVAALQGTVSEVKAGAWAEPFAIRSNAWGDALRALDEPCQAAGSELSVSMFVGG